MSDDDDVMRLQHARGVAPLARGRYWVQAVEYQARRLLRTYESMMQCSTISMEEQFLLTATRKALRWLSESSRIGQLPSAVQNHVEAFMNAMSVARELRDMREHDDEYDCGRGRRPENMRTVVSSPSGRVEMDHQMAVIYRDSGPVGSMQDLVGLHVILGGRFDVVAAVREAGVLARYLVEQENAERANELGPFASCEPVSFALRGPESLQSGEWP